MVAKSLDMGILLKIIYNRTILGPIRVVEPTIKYLKLEVVPNPYFFRIGRGIRFFIINAFFSA